MSGAKVLVYLLRRDLRLCDNPILHHLAANSDHSFTHLLPIFIFPPHQIEISGFLKVGEESPYPAALSRLAGYWRCGPHRARFLAQSVWDLKSSLEGVNSGLLIRLGSAQDVLKQTIRGLEEHQMNIGAVWMTEEKSSEEVEEQEAIMSVCAEHDIDFKLWQDEKYLVDDRDTGLRHPEELPDIFTSYRKSQEPLRDRPRPALPRPQSSQLPPLPAESCIPSQQGPFSTPTSLEDLEDRLVAPLGDVVPDPPGFPTDVQSAHPFRGGETEALKRLQHLVVSGAMSKYKDTRNGMLGRDFSTKLSAFLALGSLTSRQIHAELLHFEDGNKSVYDATEGYGSGENDGTRAVRFELLWRDYMRLCTIKFGRRLFRLSGLRQKHNYARVWKTADRSTAENSQQPPPDRIAQFVRRFNEGTTGMGLIDASQRELLHTGYTSNRARQNVASFLSKHLGIDWRYGAEWYEMMLVDYDVSSNWANWQYVSGVGNDPRGDERTFNPVKQAFDYDREGAYVRSWVPEVRSMERLENVFQVCTASKAELERCGLEGHVMVTDPLKRINFTVGHKPKASRNPYTNKKQNGNGGRGRRGGSDRGGARRGGGRRGGSGQGNERQNGSWYGRSQQGSAPTNNAGDGQGANRGARDASQYDDRPLIVSSHGVYKGPNKNAQVNGTVSSGRDNTPIDSFGNDNKGSHVRGTYSYGGMGRGGRGRGGASVGTGADGGGNYQGYYRQPSYLDFVPAPPPPPGYFPRPSVGGYVG